MYDLLPPHCHAFSRFLNFIIPVGSWQLVYPLKSSKFGCKLLKFIFRVKKDQMDQKARMDSKETLDCVGEKAPRESGAFLETRCCLIHIITLKVVQHLALVSQFCCDTNCTKQLPIVTFLVASSIA